MIIETSNLTRVQQQLTKKELPDARSIMFKNSSIDLDGNLGRLATHIVKFLDLDISIARVTSSGHRIALEDQERVTFLLPEQGRLDIRIGEQEHRLESGRLAGFRPTPRQTQASVGRHGRFQGLAILVPMSRVRDLEDRMEGKDSSAFPTDMVNVSGAAGRRLRQSLALLAEDLMALPSSSLPSRIIAEIGALIDEQICEMAGRASEIRASRRALPALNRVRRAQEIMHSRSEEPMSMLDLAQDLGVSMRSLQLAFNDVYGEGPREVLTSIRLNKARQRLLAAKGDGQVTMIALESGFSHLGRFSQAYSQAFGERPSDTLARRRA